MNIILFVRLVVACALTMSLAGCANTREPLAPASPVLQRLLIEPGAVDIPVSQVVQLQAVGIYSNGTTSTPPNVVWSSLSLSIVALSPQGTLTCSAAGDATITATSDLLSTAIQITCLPQRVVSLRLAETPSIIRSEMPYEYHVMAYYDDGSTKDVSQQSVMTTDVSIATLDDRNKVTCNHSGNSTISATFSGLSVNASYTCVLHSFARRPGFIELSTTFEGPFASWINIRSGFGATGDGVSDDSAAFQAALDSLGATPGVLWIPKGTYRISKPLRITGAANFSILGEDPLTTSLVWGGAPGTTMLTLSGCMGINIGRITWDGNGQTSQILELTWDDVSNYYPTRNYIHDSRLMNTQTGIHTGWAGETTIDRVHFDHNTVAGVSLGDWNALNFNVVDSLFTDDAIGVTNVYGAGAFNVSNSVFVRSTIADMKIGNTGPFSLRNNLSVDSKRFLETGMTGAPASLTIQNNTIYHPSSDPLVVGTPGSLALIDNTFSRLDPRMHVMDGIAAQPLVFLSLGNVYHVPVPYGGYIGAYTSIDEAPSSGSEDLQWAVPTKVYVPPPSGRPVFEVSPVASTAELEEIVSTAAAKAGVVHFPAGTFNIDTTISVPPGSSLVLSGDGPLTDLSASAKLSGPLLQLTGGQVSISDMQFSDASQAGASFLLQLNIPDAPGSTVICDECAIYGGSASGMDIDGLDHARIEVKVATMASGGSEAAQTIHGGPLRQRGKITLGNNSNFMTSIDSYYVDQGGTLLNEDGWHDVGQGQSQFTVGDTASVTQQGGVIYVPSTSKPLGTLLAFQGHLNLLGTEVNSYFSGSTVGSSSISMMGITQFSTDPGLLKDISAKPSYLNDWASPSNATPVSMLLPPADPSSVENAFAMTRSQVLTRRLAPQAGSSQVRLSRLIVSGPGIHITNSSSTSGSDAYTLLGATDTTPNCSVGEVPLNGSWVLGDGSDGSYTLNNGSAFLSEVPLGVGSGFQVALRASASNAWDRWLLIPTGDGSLAISNRATGHMLTKTPSSCAYASEPDDLPNQSWSLRPLLL